MLCAWSFLCAAGAARGQTPPDPVLQPPSAAIATPLSDQINLNDAERLLLERSASLAASRYQLQVSQQLRLIAGYKPNPVLYFAVEQIRTYSQNSDINRPLGYNSNAAAQPTYTFQYQKIIERGGKRELRTEQADASVQAARYAILDAFRVQLFGLRQAYASALLARDNLTLAQSIDQQYARTEDLTSERVKSGDLAPVDLYRVQTGRLQYQQAVLDARNAYQQSVRDLLNFLSARPEDIQMGKPPDLAARPGAAAPTAPASSANLTTVSGPAVSFGPIRVEGSFLEPADIPDLVGLRKLALDQRPDVQAARANVRAAEAAERLAGAQRHRDIAIGLEYQDVAGDHSVGFTTQVPLFTYNNQFAAIAQAQAQLRNAQAILRQTELQAITDVEKAYLSYQTARQSVALYSSGNLAQVDKLRTIADYSYRSGASSLFELLDAQRAAAQAAVAYNQSRSNYQLSFYQLQSAVGGSLQ